MNGNQKKRFGILLAGTVFCLLFSACASVPAASPVYSAMRAKTPDLEKIAALAREEPNAKTPDGETCLYYAIVHENFAVAETLAANGARLNREEIYALFTPFERRKTSTRYKFLAPIFPEKTQSVSGVPAENFPRSRQYSCVAGDTPSRIARKLNCSQEELREVNPDVDFARLKRGQKLNIPKK